jgi:hypothetical protein
MEPHGSFLAQFLNIGAILRWLVLLFGQMSP